jgi:hypothetical protein
MKDTFILEFPSPCGLYQLCFEDDGRVAYAYLKEGRDILGDVWLYNRCPTPLLPEWRERNNIPFANCEGYMSEEGRIQRDVGRDDVLVDWEGSENGPLAYIYLFGDLLGVIGVGDKPGFARFANKDGPLARVMQFEERH